MKKMKKPLFFINKPKKTIHTNEEPMSPMTMMRNALGIEYGGSGVSINEKKYEESVVFWSQNAIIK